MFLVNIRQVLFGKRVVDSLNHTQILSNLSGKKLALFSSALATVLLVLPTTDAMAADVSIEHEYEVAKSSLVAETKELATKPAEVQTVTVASDAISEPVVRDEFTVTAPPPPPPPPVPVVMTKSKTSAIVSYGPLVNDPNAAVQFPFQHELVISSPFGKRVPVCTPGYGCGSDFHSGVDFQGPVGTQLFVIADGVVISSGNSGAYGNHVVIEHVIDGVVTRSLYAHMVEGSSPLSVGQSVKVGDPVGLLGNSGRSTGSHLHFEIQINGSPVDPMTWGKWNTGVRS